MSIRTVIGLDYSLTSTGMASWVDGRVFLTSIPTSPFATLEQRSHTTIGRILAQLDPGGWESTLVTTEGRIKPRDAAVMTALDMAELRGACNHALHVRGISRGGHRADVNPLTLKVYATGDGHASKLSMVLAARGRLGEVAGMVQNDDEADALWLLAMTLDHMGMPLVPMPKRNRDAIKRVDWPVHFTQSTVERAL